MEIRFVGLITMQIWLILVATETPAAIIPSLDKVQNAGLEKVSKPLKSLICSMLWKCGQLWLILEKKGEVSYR